MEHQAFQIPRPRRKLSSNAAGPLGHRGEEVVKLPPLSQDLFCRGSVDLLAISSPIDFQKGIVTLVRGAAYAVCDEGHCVAEIDSSQHGRKNADIGL